jgi:hypothetical protein
MDAVEFEDLGPRLGPGELERFVFPEALGILQGALVVSLPVLVLDLIHHDLGGGIFLFYRKKIGNVGRGRRRSHGAAPGGHECRREPANGAIFIRKGTVRSDLHHNLMFGSGVGSEGGRSEGQRSRRLRIFCRRDSRGNGFCKTMAGGPSERPSSEA